MILCELNNQRGFRGASGIAVKCDSWEEVEALVLAKFPGRVVAGRTAQERVEALRHLLDTTCTVTFHVIED